MAQPTLVPNDHLKQQPILISSIAYCIISIDIPKYTFENNMLSQKPAANPAPSAGSDNHPQYSMALLLKSKDCVDKLSNKLAATRYLYRNGEAIKGIEETAKQISGTIANKIQGSFSDILNEQIRLPFADGVSGDVGSRVDATKKLMDDYWAKKNDNTLEAGRKSVELMKQNRLPKIKSVNENTEQSRVALPSKGKKKAIMSTLNVKMQEKSREIEGLKKSKEEKALAFLYSNMVHVVDYQVQNNTQEFLLFQRLNSQKWDQIENVLRAIQKFSRQYDLRYITVDLQKVMQLVQAKSKSQKSIPISTKKTMGRSSSKIVFNYETVCGPIRRNYTPHELLSCLQNSQEISSQNCRKPGIRFYGNKGKLRAIIKIQAVWKGKLTYNKTRKIKDLIKKITSIQRAYRIYRGYMNTKQTIKQRCLDRIEWYNNSQKRFRDNYRVNELTRKIKYEVHICSDSQSEWQRLSTEKFIEKQNCYLARIFKAFTQGDARDTRIIFVSAIPIPADVISYYSKLLELGGAANYKNRLYFVSAEESEEFLERLPLARALYYCPSILKKIRSIVNGQYSYIVPSTPSVDYISASHYLNLPVYCSSPQTLLSLQTNSGFKTLVQHIYRDDPARLPLAPFAKNIYSAKCLASELTQLIERFPTVAKWVLKIDNQTNSRGLAYAEVGRLLPRKLLKYMRKCAAEHHPTQQDPVSPAIRDLHREVYGFVLESLSEGEKITIVSGKLYGGQRQFLNFFYTNGGIVEAAISNTEHEPQTACYCVEIEPDNQWRFVCNYNKITVKSKAFCSYFQQSNAQKPEPLQLIVQQLIKRQCFGYFVVDFIREPGQNQRAYLNGLKCYLDSYSSSSFMREFISKDSNALYVPYIAHSNISRISMSTFFHLCRLQNISFDIERKMGNIFMFLNGLESGCLGMMTFNDSSKIETFIHAAEVLDFFSGKMDKSVSAGLDEQFLMLRNSVNGYLNGLRKRAQARKSQQYNPSASRKSTLSYSDKQYLN